MFNIKTTKIIVFIFIGLISLTLYIPITGLLADSVPLGGRYSNTLYYSGIKGIFVALAYFIFSLALFFLLIYVMSNEESERYYNYGKWIGIIASIELIITLFLL